MTKVYSVSQYVGHQYPLSGNVLMRARREAIEAIGAVISVPFRLSAGGSAQRGDADVASDIDMLLVLDAPAATFEDAATSVFAQQSARAVEALWGIERRHNVPFDFFIEQKYLCQLGHHSLGYGYTQSLTLVAQKEWLEVDIGYIAWPDDGPRRDCLAYIEHKIRKLSRGLYAEKCNFESESTLEILADGLDAPFHALRRLREWRLGLWSEIGRVDLVRLASREGWLSEEGIDHLWGLIGLRKGYSLLLLSGEARQKEYLLCLSELRKAAYQSLVLLRHFQSDSG